jgi:hypothetical protein
LDVAGGVARSRTLPSRRTSLPPPAAGSGARKKTLLRDALDIEEREAASARFVIPDYPTLDE